MVLKSVGLGWTSLDDFVDSNKPIYFFNSINICKCVNSKFAKL